MIERVLTIGAYGFDAATFVDALRSAGADVFIDIRARRGVRGAAYAFANAKRLQRALAEAGIRYVHVKDLAPSRAVRDAQYRADAELGIAKRERTSLGPAFVAAYENECLSGFDPGAFAETHVREACRPVLFCVEREPRACHRSLVAPRLAQAFAVPVIDLGPPSA